MHSDNRRGTKGGTKASPKMKLLIAIAVSSASLLSAAPALAQIIDSGANIYGGGHCGTCWLTNGLMSTPAGLNSLQTDIVSTIKKTTEGLASEQEKQIQSQKNLMNQQLQSLTDFIKKLDATTDSNNYINGSADFNQPSNICNEPAASTAVAQGRGSSKALASKMMANLDAWNKSSPTQYAVEQKIAALDPKQTVSTTIFDPDINSATTATDANTYIALLISNKKPLDLTSNLANTPGSDAQKVGNAAWLMSTGLADNAITWVSSNKQPTVDPQLFMQQWQESGGSGNPPGYNTAVQKISPDGALDVQVLARYANEKWYKSLASEDSRGLSRENTQMEAISLRQQETALKSMEHLASMMAVNYAQVTAKSRHESLSNQSAITVSQFIRGVTK